MRIQHTSPMTLWGLALVVAVPVAWGVIRWLFLINGWDQSHRYLAEIAAVVAMLTCGVGAIVGHARINGPKRRVRAGHCPNCNYDLRRDFSRGCPECGWQRETDDR